MTDQEKIIDELEKALVTYKTEWYWKDKDEAKANIDRLIRKAEVYGNDPQVQQMLKKIKSDMLKFRIMQYCKNHKILVGVAVFFIICFISSFFGTMAGDKVESEIERDRDGNSKIESINKAISIGNFADAYDIIDNMVGSSEATKMNAKVLSAEIPYLLGDDELSSDNKSTKIIMTIKDRSKYSVKGYDPTSRYYVEDELEIQVSQLEYALEMAKASDQTTVAKKLESALSSTRESLNRHREEKINN